MAKEGKDKKYVRVLFAPRDGRNLLEQYPELKEHDEFTNLSKEEMLIAWYYGVVFRGIKEYKDRIRMALRATFGQSLVDSLARNYIDGNLRPEMRSAFSKFENFTLTERLMAFAMAQKTMFTYEKILERNIEDLISEGKWKEIKDWQGVVADINKEMPELIKKIEGGYGTGEVIETGNEKGIQTYYERKTQNS